MTLNLMLTTADAVYLTGDFRLTYGDGSIDDDLLAQKIVPVAKLEWCALVAFCGIARTGDGIDVGDWISQQVRVSDSSETMTDFVDRLQSATWFSKVQGYKRLSISLVGYEKKRPFSILLSNFQDMNGGFEKQTLDSLVIHRETPNQPEIRVFGDSTAISNSETATLVQLLKQNENPVKLQEALAKLNSKASQSVNTISPQCVVGRLHATGDGEVRAFGINDEEDYIPRFVLRQLVASGVIGFELKTDETGEKIPNPGWRRRH